MNSQERMQAAMGNEEPDRVPVMCQLALGHCFLHFDSRPSEISFDCEAFAEARAELGRYGGQ